jgi:dihydroorotase
MSEGNLLIKGGTIVKPEGLFKADILMEEGKIVAIGKNLSSSSVEVIDASGKLIFPGVVDEHVHMREPGLEHKDNFTNGTRAAAAGGVTTVLEMPNTLPPADTRQRFEEKLRLLKPKAFVDFGLYGVIHSDNADEFEEIVYAGAVGFKVFLGPTTGNIPPPDDGTLFEIMKKSAKLNVPIAFHAENYALVKHFTEKVKATGRSDPAAHTDARPSICEEDAIQKIILYSKRTGGKALIVHMSAKEGVYLLEQARKEGINVIGETNPHYLLLTRDDYVKYGTRIKVNPPIRDRVDQKALWEAIRKDVISVVASDHAPHSADEKAGDIWKCAAGFTGVQTLFPLMLDSALKGKIPLTKLPEVLSLRPAKIFGLYPMKGTIAIGSDGDLVIVDPAAENTIREEDLYAKYPITPFIGWKVKGRIEYTVLRGRIIAKHGRVVDSPKGIWIRGTWA